MSQTISNLVHNINTRKQLREQRRERLLELHKFLFEANLGIGFHQKYLFEGEVLSNIPMLPNQEPSISTKYLLFGWGVVTREVNQKKERRWCLYTKHSRKWGGRLVPIMEAGEWYQEQFVQRCETFLTELATHLEDQNTLTKAGLAHLDNLTPY